MKVTNVSVKLAPESADRLKAFCTMTLDDEFVVRDLKVIEGTSGLFVAMPSRKLTDHCPKCGGKNHLRAKFCNDCGAKLGENRVSDEDSQGKLHADIAHPINSDCRNRLQEVILDAYREECRSAGREQDAREVDRELGDAPPAPAPPPPEPAAPAEPSAETPAPEPPKEAAPGGEASAAEAEPAAPESPAPEAAPPEPAAGESSPAEEQKETGGGEGGEEENDKGAIFGEGIL
ncbi:MAG: SpoVG family protein [Phycisphaerae bacterium]